MNEWELVGVLITAIGSLAGVVAWMYKRIERLHQERIIAYQEGIQTRDAEITRLRQKLESLYEKFNARRNGG